MTFSRIHHGYAQAWQGKRRDGSVRQRVLSEPLSPDEYRVNGIVRNFGPRYKAFGVKPGEAMYLPPKQRVSIWQ